ncbi:MAG: hypothetical protein ACQEV7_19010 [Bacillota bacterium]
MKTFFISLLIVIATLASGCSKPPSSPQQAVDTKTSQRIKPPEIQLVLTDDALLYSEPGSYDWTERNGDIEESVTVEADTPKIIGARMDAVYLEPEEKVAIKFDSDFVPELQVFVHLEDRNTEEVALEGNTIILPSEKGRYIYEVHGEWPEGNASYIFVVEIK